MLIVVCKALWLYQRTKNTRTIFLERPDVKISERGVCMCVEGGGGR